MSKLSSQLLFSLLLLLIGTISGLYSSRSDVVQIEDPADFKSKVTRGEGVWLVEFYAPWCGHCRNLVPEWDKAASALKGVVNVAAVDATKEANQRLAQEYQVQGFPTIKVFGLNKRKPTDYNGARTADAIVQGGISEARKMVKDRMSGKKGSGGGGGSSSSRGSSSGGSGGSGAGSKRSKGDVVELNELNFESLVLDSNDEWLVEFYAPWCGHCKALAPEWAQAATELKGSVKVGAVDATQHQALAAKYDVRGYPTIKLFPPGPKLNDPIPYNGPRESPAIVQYALQVLDERGGAYAQAVQQITDKAMVRDTCEGKRICVIAALPHILDSGKAGREAYIETLTAAAKKFRGQPFSFLWTEGGAQPQLEAAAGLSFGYPAVMAISYDKGAFAVQRGAYSTQSIANFCQSLTTGSEKVVSFGEEHGGKVPKIVKVEAWDGEEAPPPEEEFSLDELFGDDRVEEEKEEKLEEGEAKKEEL